MHIIALGFISNQRWGCSTEKRDGGRILASFCLFTTEFTLGRVKCLCCNFRTFEMISFNSLQNNYLFRIYSYNNKNNKYWKFRKYNWLGTGRKQKINQTFHSIFVYQQFITYALKETWKKFPRPSQAPGIHWKVKRQTVTAVNRSCPQFLSFLYYFFSIYSLKTRIV